MQIFDNNPSCRDVMISQFSGLRQCVNRIIRSALQLPMVACQELAWHPAACNWPMRGVEGGGWCCRPKTAHFSMCMRGGRGHARPHRGTAPPGAQMLRRSHAWHVAWQQAARVPDVDNTRSRCPGAPRPDWPPAVRPFVTTCLSWLRSSSSRSWPSLPNGSLEPGARPIHHHEQEVRQLRSCAAAFVKRSVVFALKLGSLAVVSHFLSRLHCWQEFCVVEETLSAYQHMNKQTN